MSMTRLRKPEGAFANLSLQDRRVIEMLFKEGPLSRKELAGKLDLGGASLTRSAERLISAGVVTEEVDRQGQVGQPRRPLSVAPGQVFSAGINFEVERIDAVIVDLAGNIIARREDPLGQAAPDCAAATGRVMIEEMLGEARLERAALVGVGVSVPGNFSHEGGLIRAHSLFPAFDDRSLRESFENGIGLPVTIENDGACGALGEYFYGGGHQNRVFMQFFLGHGFTSGVLIDGRLFRGAHGNACVTGVLFPYGAPRPTGLDLIELLRAADVPCGDLHGLRNLPEAAEPIVAEWATRSARQLEQAARISTGFFDPEVIVIGGRLPASLNERLVAEMDVAALDGPSRGLSVAPVRASKLGPASGAIGAACAPFFTHFFPGAVA